MNLDDAMEELRSKLALFTLLICAPVLAFAIRGVQAYVAFWRWVRKPHDAYTLLWIAAVALFVGGDTLTTAAGLHVGMRESTAAVRWMLANWGWLGLVVVKVGVCWLLWTFSRLLPRPYVYHAPALCLTLTGGYATLWNSWLIVHLTA